VPLILAVGVVVEMVAIIAVVESNIAVVEIDNHSPGPSEENEVFLIVDFHIGIQIKSA